MSIMYTVLDKNIRKVKRPEHYLKDSKRFAMTIRQKLFDSDSKDSWFHIIWAAELEVSHRDSLTEDINSEERKLRKATDRKTLLTEDELSQYRYYFNLSCHAEGELEVNRRGKGAGKKKKIPGFVIDSFERNNEYIARADRKCGYMVLISDKEITAEEAMEAMVVEVIPELV